MSDRSRLVRTSVLLAGAILLARILGGVLQIVIAATYGASADLDACLVAMSVPNIVSEWFIVAAPAVVLVPVLIDLRAKDLGQDARRLLHSFANALFVAVAAVVVVGTAFAPPLIRLLAPGFGPEERAVAITVLRIAALALLPAAFTGVLRAELHAHGRFLAPALTAGVATAATIVTVVVAGGRIGVYAIVVGASLGAVCAAVVNLLSARDLREPHFRGFDLRSSRARKTWGLLGTFLIIGTAAQINFLSDRFFASFLPPGSISILEYGEKLASFFLLIFAAAVAVPAYTDMSGRWSAEDVDGFRATVVSSVKLIAVATLPVMAVCIVLREPLVSVLLEHGVFSGSDAASVSAVFGVLAIVWTIYAFAQVLMYGFFAMGQTRGFLLIVVAGIIANVALDIVLVGPLGVLGLALATTLATAASNTAAWGVLSRRVGGFGVRAEARFVFGVVAASAMAGAAAWLVAHLVGPMFASATVLDQLALLAVAGGSAVIVYLLACRLLGVGEVREAWSMLRGKLAAERLDPDSLT